MFGGYSFLNYIVKIRYFLDPDFKWADITQWLTKTNLHYAPPADASAGQSWWKDILANYPVFLLYLGFKVLEMYYNSRHTRQLAELRGTEHQSVTVPSLVSGGGNKCPICGESLKPETLAFLKTAPKAYHYDCLLTKIAETKVCPASGYSVNQEDIRRVYLS